MATYAIGDLQGCQKEFSALLKKIKFSKKDELWLVGDLVNRGPDSLQVLRRIMAMGTQAKVVLGNHDLHFLAILFGGHQPNRNDTFTELLTAPDAEKLGHWLRTQPLLYRDRTLGYLMVHAGLPAQWTTKQASGYAAEVHQVLAGPAKAKGANKLGYRDYLRDLYGNEPPGWDDQLQGMQRLRVITNYFTRMRLVDAAGNLNFSHKGSLADRPKGLYPWFEMPLARPRKQRILFGHWAALEGETSADNCIALDTGCVWGRGLTAFCLETGKRYFEAARDVA